MMGGIIVSIEPFENEGMEGIVPKFSTVRDKETLGNGGMSDNVHDVGAREEESYGEDKYLVNCTSRIVRSMDMWVQWLMTMVRGANLTLTYGLPRGNEREGRQPGCGPCVRSRTSFRAGGDGDIVVKASHREFVLTVVLAVYEVVAEGLFNLICSFAEEIFGILGSAFSEFSGSFVLAVKEVALFFGEVATVGKGNVLLETRGTQLNRGSRG
jgi:hypothetical protein